MNNKALSLLEILIATIILALVVTGLTNLFITGKRYVLHNRARMSAGELGKFFLDPLYIHVMQNQWSGADYINTNPLRLRANDAGIAENLDRAYSPVYDVSAVPTMAASQMRKVRVNISWNEPTG